MPTEIDMSDMTLYSSSLQWSSDNLGFLIYGHYAEQEGFYYIEIASESFELIGKTNYWFDLLPPDVLAYNWITWSNDLQSVVVVDILGPGRTTLLLVDLDANTSQRIDLTEPNPQISSAVVWLPDSRSLLFSVFLNDQTFLSKANVADGRLEYILPINDYIGGITVCPQ